MVAYLSIILSYDFIKRNILYIPVTKATQRDPFSLV